MTHRRGPAVAHHAPALGGVLRLSSAHLVLVSQCSRNRGAQACAQGPCMTPPQLGAWKTCRRHAELKPVSDCMRPSPLLVQRYVSTPRRCAGPVQVQL